MLSAFFFVPGVLLYMMLRPKETLDLTFQRSLEEEYLLQDIEVERGLPQLPQGHRGRLCRLPALPHDLAGAMPELWSDVRCSLEPLPVLRHCQGRAAHNRIRPVIQPIERFVRSEPQSTIAEMPVLRAIEELEAQAFYRLETAPPPPQVTASSGRAFDRRKTREMNRVRNLNGRTTALEPNGSGVATHSSPDGVKRLHRAEVGS